MVTGCVQIGVPVGAIADNGHTTGGWRQVGRRTDLGVAARSVHLEPLLEHLTPAGIDSNDDRSGGLSSSQYLEAGERDHVAAGCEGQRLDRRQAHPEPGEAPWPDVHDELLDVGDGDPGTGERLANERSQLFGVTTVGVRFQCHHRGLAASGRTDRHPHHLDVYRLDGPDEALDLDLPELLESGVTVIEWGERILGALPPERLTVTFRYPPIEAPDNDRDLHLTLEGEGWPERHGDLVAALDRWVTPC